MQKISDFTQPVMTTPPGKQQIVLSQNKIVNKATMSFILILSAIMIKLLKIMNVFFHLLDHSSNVLLGCQFVDYNH